MTSTKENIFVGFGLGAIQSGLFLYETQKAGRTQRMVVAEVIPEIVQNVRCKKGFIKVNIAHPDHIEAVDIGPIEVLNPNIDRDRCILIDAIASAKAISTALPGTKFYGDSTKPNTPSSIMLAGFQKKIRSNGPIAVVYTAENHNHAAEILQRCVLENIAHEEQERILNTVEFLNTVIGKMSGITTDRGEIDGLGLTTMVPNIDKAILVEAFNQILISKIHFPKSEYSPLIDAFKQKDNLLPFEEAKLYGHNATHALAAYIGSVLGVQRIAELPNVIGMMTFLRKAFIEESGAALIHRYQGFDPLFTLPGYTAYANDLLDRMVNPYLADTVERVGRDVKRKLGWEDRLVGTIRLAMAEGVTPKRYALGAAAALCRLEPLMLSSEIEPDGLLASIWGDQLSDQQNTKVLSLIKNQLNHLRAWKASKKDDPQALFDLSSFS